MGKVLSGKFSFTGRDLVIGKKNLSVGVLNEMQTYHMRGAVVE